MLMSSVQSTQAPSGSGGWWASWWDFSSFGPDALIGIGTGLIVAMIVLGAERRLAARARTLEVTNAMGGVVEKARSVLKHRIEWDEEALNLYPDRTHLDRLVPAVSAVPSGDPQEKFPGYHHAVRVVEVLDEVTADAAALDNQAGKHEWNENVLAIPYTVANTILALVNEPGPVTNDWTFQWSDRVHRPVPKSLVEAVENDQELRQYLQDYVRDRRLLEAHRKAFLTADGMWRADEWAALTQRFMDVPHNPIKSAWRRLKYNRAVEHAQAKAEAEANKIILNVDPMAY